MSKIVWDINQYNGEQDTPYLGPAGCFQTSAGVDIRKEPPFVKLSTEMKLERTFDDDVCFMKNLADFGLSGILVCLENGKIYLDGVLKKTLNTGTTAYNRVIGVGYMVNASGDDYLYYFSNLSFNTGKMHRSTPDLVTWNDSYREFTTVGNNITNDIIPVISQTNRIIFGARDTIFEFDELEPTSFKQLLQIDMGEEIIAITEYDTSYRVYSSVTDGTSFVHGKIYKWDGLTIDYDSIEIWKNLPFQGVENTGAYDKIITGQSSFYTDLYQNPGKNSLRINLEGDTGKRNFSRYISTRGDITYISGKNKDGKYCIYTMGQYFNGFPESLVGEYYISATNNAFTFHSHTPDRSYFACTDNKVYSVYHTNDYSVAKYVNTGYFTTKKWVGNGIHTKKSVDYMYIGYKLETGTSISIYADKGTGLKLLRTIAITTEEPSTQKGIRIDAKEFQSVDLGDFYELELKGVLTTTDTTKTPAIGPMLLFCNDEYNK